MGRRTGAGGRSRSGGPPPSGDREIPPRGLEMFRRCLGRGRIFRSRGDISGRCRDISRSLEPPAAGSAVTCDSKLVESELLGAARTILFKSLRGELLEPLRRDGKRGIPLRFVGKLLEGLHA